MARVEMIVDFKVVIARGGREGGFRINFVVRLVAFKVELHDSC